MIMYVFDQNLTDTEKIIAYQKAIDDATRRTIHFASLQGEIMERYYKKSKADTTRCESWSLMGPIFEKVIQACCCLQPIILLYSFATIY